MSLNGFKLSDDGIGLTGNDYDHAMNAYGMATRVTALAMEQAVRALAGMADANQMAIEAQAMMDSDAMDGNVTSAVRELHLFDRKTAQAIRQASVDTARVFLDMAAKGSEVAFQQCQLALHLKHGGWDGDDDAADGGDFGGVQ